MDTHGMNLKTLIATLRDGRSYARLSEDAGGVPSGSAWLRPPTNRMHDGRWGASDQRSGTPATKEPSHCNGP
jgi:hypothetical protein